MLLSPDEDSEEESGRSSSYSTALCPSTVSSTYSTSVVPVTPPTVRPPMTRRTEDGNGGRPDSDVVHAAPAVDHGADGTSSSSPGLDLSELFESNMATLNAKFVTRSRRGVDPEFYAIGTPTPEGVDQKSTVTIGGECGTGDVPKAGDVGGECGTGDVPAEERRPPRSTFLLLPTAGNAIRSKRMAFPAVGSSRKVVLLSPDRGEEVLIAPIGGQQQDSDSEEESGSKDSSYNTGLSRLSSSVSSVLLPLSRLSFSTESRTQDAGTRPPMTRSRTPTPSGILSHPLGTRGSAEDDRLGLGGLTKVLPDEDSEEESGSSSYSSGLLTIIIVSVVLAIILLGMRGGHWWTGTRRLFVMLVLLGVDSTEQGLSIPPSRLFEAVSTLVLRRRFYRSPRSCSDLCSTTGSRERFDLLKIRK